MGNSTPISELDMTLSGFAETVQADQPYVVNIQYTFIEVGWGGILLQVIGN